MLKWVKQLLGKEPLSPEEVFGQLRRLKQDGRIEELWELMDQAPAILREEVETQVLEKGFSEVGHHAAVIWLGYQSGNRSQPVSSGVSELLEDSLVWAFPHEENQVLLGGALGALDAFEMEAREALALRVFDRLGDGAPRRYWLLMKVRTPAMLAAVAASMREFSKQEETRMMGAFRQFRPEDLENLEALYEPGMPGSKFFEEALSAAGR